MTPFGVKIRDWRQRKNLTLHQQAKCLAYLQLTYLRLKKVHAVGHLLFSLIKFVRGWV